MNKIKDTMAHMAHFRKGNTKPSKSTNKRNRSRGWTFTINNPDLSDKEKYIDTLTQQFIICKWYIFGIEVGEKKKTPHIQGYVYYKNPMSFSSIKELIPRAHIEKAKGTPKQNFTYCSKEGNYYTNMDSMKSPAEYMEKVLEELKQENKDANYEPWMDNIIEI